MTEFTERYRQLSDKELLAILGDASSYQSTAVETAKQELASRKLSEEQIALIETQVAREKQQKETQIQKRREENEALKNDFFSLFTTVNPFKPELELYEKQIRFMCWFFLAIALYTIYSNYTLVFFYIDDIIEGKIGADLVVYFLDIVAIILGTILFWKRKMLGWILIMLYIATGVTNLIFSLIYHAIHPIPEYFTIIDDGLVPENMIGTILISLIFFGTNLYVLLKEKIRTVFKIDKNISALVIVLTAMIQGALWFTLFIT